MTIRGLAVGVAFLGLWGILLAGAVWAQTGSLSAGQVGLEFDSYPNTAPKDDASESPSGPPGAVIGASHAKPRSCGHLASRRHAATFANVALLVTPGKFHCRASCRAVASR